MFRKYIRWPLKRKEPFTENMRNGLFARVSVLFRINVKISDTVKSRPERNERNIAGKGAQHDTANVNIKKQVSSLRNPLPHRVRHS